MFKITEYQNNSWIIKFDFKSAFESFNFISKFIYRQHNTLQTHLYLILCISAKGKLYPNKPLDRIKGVSETNSVA